jgi:hypothetical protein
MQEVDTAKDSMTSQEIRTAERSGPDLLSDCRLMLKFARKEARSIPTELTSDIARLDSVLKHLGLPSVSTVPEKLIPDIEKPEAEGAAAPLSPTELILKIHAALSQIVAPATAQSLQVSEPPPGRHRFLGGMPLLVKIAAWVAIVSAVGFVMTSIPVAKQKLDMATKSSATPTPTPSAGATPGS